MSAIEAYAQLLKTAASGERPHSMIPGRTTKSKRGTVGTAAPLSNPIRVDPLEEEEPKKPKVPKAPRAPRAPSTPKTQDAPKVDISFSVKVGSQQNVTAQPSYATQPPAAVQGNTGANVDGAFHPDSQVGGSYGTTSLPEERDSMRTPALPFGDNGDSEYVGDIKISSIVARVLQKMAEPQAELPMAEEPPVVPEPPAMEVPTEEQELQRLLQAVKQQNPSFYATKVGHLIPPRLKAK